MKSALAVWLFAATLTCVAPLASAELPGAESPQEVMAKIGAASKAGDYGAVMNLVEPSARRSMAAAKLWGAYLRISIAETNAEASVSIAAQESYFTAEERAKAGQEGQEEAKGAAELRQRLANLLNGFGLTLDLAPALPVKDMPRAQALEALIENVDQGKLIAALDEFLYPDDPPLPESESKCPPEVTDYRIEGDRATARSGDHVLDFVRIDGRWYSVPPPLPEIREPKGLPCPPSPATERPSAETLPSRSS